MWDTFFLEEGIVSTDLSFQEAIVCTALSLVESMFWR